MNRKSSRYESFNARNLTPEQVAETFIANEEFSLLCKNSNSVLMGPRGSGKTTMFKMLTVRALSSWHGRAADEIRASIAFSAVYVPTDIHWHHQLTYSQAQLAKLPRYSRCLSETATNINIFSSIIQTMRDRIECEKLRVTSRAESILAETLINEWKLPPTIPSLSTVNQALLSRINEIRLITNRAIYSEISDDETKNLPDYCFLDYQAASTAACAKFDEIFKVKAKLWALCFDELELAPDWLQDRLFSEMRSTNQQFIFKLSTSPTPRFVGKTKATPRNDFKCIYLWSHGKKNLRAFCNNLTKDLLERRLGRIVDPSLIFGHSPVSFDQGKGDYEQGSITYNVIRELARTDAGLRALLESHGISAENPTSDDQNKRDQVLRKVKPIAFHRNEYRKISNDGKVVGRSRKVSSLFHGIEAIYDICDGNPRWLIGIVDDILAMSSAKQGNVSQVTVIPPPVQARVLAQASSQFQSLIQALPEATITLYGRPMHLSQLIKKIGLFFFEEQVSRPFSLDPAGSFVVDAATPESLVKLLRLATYQGAVVYVDPDSKGFDPDLRGKRFRLSFMLSPALRLPLRLYDSVPLSKCIGQSNNSETPDLPLGDA